ncbi:V-set and immunoglobulin domain-containing protein 1 [Nothoprocta perdicaria]|uniref:V-set and immunoglobulin domain-containing protein 1 n=1 Tax=Nothoprocta perdicaria TaxID=30464 RepID=UPI000E1BA38A|nr:V-set and immunoglobulin domain-containing protein 1 [Nothoprocta perdicaria]
MLKILLILSTLAGLNVSSITVTVPQPTVNVTSGGNITLLCTFTGYEPQGNVLIQWSFYSAKESQLHAHSPCAYIHSMDEKSVSQCQKMVYVTDARGRCSSTHKIYYSSGGQSHSLGGFQNRITAATNPGNASITISNMQPSETGSYTCEVVNLQGDAGQGQKSMIVNVLVKPSKPFCKVEGTAEKGHQISLLCSCEQGMPRPTYRWYRLDENTLKPVTEQFDPKTGVLFIGNLTTFETGYYHCIASNFLGNSSCELDLTIKHSDGGIVAGALIGAIVAGVIICAIVWFLTRREKRKKKKSSSNEMQVMTQKQPNAEYAQVPTEENIPATTVPPSNATNEYPNVEETAASVAPENEKHEVEKEEIA